MDNALALIIVGIVVAYLSQQFLSEMPQKMGYAIALAIFLVGLFYLLQRLV